MDTFDGTQINAVAGMLGAPGATSFTIWPFLGGLIFGSIGLVAFVYGKKHQQWVTLFLGIALMGFPYFISSTLWTYIVGAALCAALFYFKGV